MPHFTIEYSANLDRRVDMAAVVEGESADRALDYPGLVEDLAGDESLALELVSMFVANARLQMDELKESLSARDIIRIRSIAHTLKGASSSVRAGAVAELAARLEEVPDVHAVPELIERLATSFAQVRAEAASIGAAADERA